MELYRLPLKKVAVIVKIVLRVFLLIFEGLYLFVLYLHRNDPSMIQFDPNNPKMICTAVLIVVRGFC